MKSRRRILSTALSLLKGIVLGRIFVGDFASAQKSFSELEEEFIRLQNPPPPPPRGPSTAPATTRSELQRLESEFKGFGNFLFPKDANFKEVKFFNGRFDCVQPVAIIQPTSEDGIVKALQLVMSANGGKGMKFSIKGGGHHYEGFSKTDGVVIDLGLLKQGDLGKLERSPVHPERSPDVITVRPGDVLGDVYSALASADGKRDRVFPAGTSDKVGVIGHLLGGGFAEFGSIKGYAAQSLEQVRIATYNGKLLEANDKGIWEVEGNGRKPYKGGISGAELMKSLRGGGQALAGIVTEAKLKTHDMSDYDMRYYKFGVDKHLNEDQTTRLVEKWQEWRLNPRFHKSVSSKLNIVREKKRVLC